MKECMFEAKTIRPTTYKGKHLKCGECALLYSKRDYNILFKAKKLIYFEFMDQILCHDCFYRVCDFIMTHEKIKIMKIKIQDGKKKRILTLKNDKNKP
jgi:hypothetical protein